MVGVLGRRELFVGGVVVAAGGAAGFIAIGGTEAADAAPRAFKGTEASELVGTVTNTTSNPSIVDVAVSSGGYSPRKSRVRTALRHRHLRTGDRVIDAIDPATGQNLTSPLFRSFEGSMHQLSADEITVGGVRLRIDENSLCYTTTGSQRAVVGRLRHSPYVKRTMNVGVLCVENVRDQTLTVQAVYFSARQPA